MYLTKGRPKKRSQWRKLVLLVSGVLAATAVAAGVWLWGTCANGIKPVNTKSETMQTVVIKSGATLDQIADQLKAAGLIRNTWAFQWYASRHGVRNALQAGTYALSPSQSVAQIIAQLSHGKVTTDLVTIIPGQRLAQVRATLINYGFAEQDVDAALNPVQYYVGHPLFAQLPQVTNLEGLIYPESFQRDGSTTPQQIVTQSLTEMQKKLTPDLLNGFSAQGLNTYDAIIMASIVEKEVSNPDDRAKVAQVFLKRMRIGMLLGSDVTAFYGSYLAGVEPSVAFDSPFNTRLHAGLPPTPISNVSVGSLEAVAHPANTDWLYFVAGDDGTTHFANTFQEHESNIERYCTTLCRR